MSQLLKAKLGVTIAEGEARCHNTRISRRCHIIKHIININVKITIAVTKKPPIKVAECLNTYQLSKCEDYRHIYIDVTGWQSD